MGSGLVRGCKYLLYSFSYYLITKKYKVITINCQLEQQTDQTRMRQKENLETFLESLLLIDDPGYKSESTHTSLPPMSRFPPTHETLNSNLLSQDFIEIKTLLVKVKTLLEKVRQ